MRPIKAVVFEPVGCLAEFPADPFNEIAARVFDRPDSASTSGSEAYWQVVELIAASHDALTPTQKQTIEPLELDAVSRAHLYEDVGPAFLELQTMQITLLLASWLSAAAVDRFLEAHSLAPFFSAVVTRDRAQAIKAGPIRAVIVEGSVPAEQVMVLADTTAGLEAAKAVGANAILLFNDYDDGKRLAAQGPAGAVVSLAELPDAIRLIAEAGKIARSR
jgi:beta-phosphoglucomutase-like phosphatase (HAD superfamily)